MQKLAFILDGKWVSVVSLLLKLAPIICKWYYVKLIILITNIFLVLYTKL